MVVSLSIFIENEQGNLYWCTTPMGHGIQRIYWTVSGGENN